MKDLIELLEIAKKEELSGRYIEVALGKYKLPESVNEAYLIFKRKLWQKY
jgi:hypothetical protein|tara:strand:+ start:372 stop:521 length:150 start_codon:yes stop_codon:yes gene_type:complete